MRQLSGNDARSLYSDTAHTNANITKIQIYDQLTAPGGSLRFKTILAHIESRLARAPVFRQKLHRVPLELDYPYWVEDENFDLEYHVRHIALPKPGDWRQFCIQASRIHARALDLTRPLWEIYVIEGLDGFLDLPAGSFALLTKVHHAAIDVDGRSGITEALHDTVAAAPTPTPGAPWFPAAPPGEARMMLRGLVNLATAPLRLAGPLKRALAGIAPSAVSFAGDMLLRPERVTATRFNSIVSAHRVFETRRFMLEEFRAIRMLVEGARVNDVVLAVCGGALRRYLDGEHELPAESLTAIAPYYLRGAAGGSEATRTLSWIRVRLCTDVADPVLRLSNIALQTSSSAIVQQAIGARELTDIGRHTPAATLALISKMLSRAALGMGRHAPLANCTISNVPGPSTPLYLCGARMTYFSAIMPIVDGMGLVFAVTSYDGRIIISPTSCRELMPDPEHFAQCVRASFEEYLALTRVPGKASKPAAARRGAKAAGKSSGTKAAGKSSGTTARRVPRARPGVKPAPAPPSGTASRRRRLGRTASTALPAARGAQPRSTARSR